MLSKLEIHRLVEGISITLDQIIAFYETYMPTGQDPSLIERVNKSDFYPTFNAISDALHRETILGVCRIWDTRKDTANLHRLAAAFRTNQVIVELASAGHKVDQSTLGKWLAAIEAGYQSAELAALKRARDRALAHSATPNELYKGNARVAEYGDERKMIGRTIPIVEQAGAFVDYSYAAGHQRDIWEDYSRKFWARVGVCLSKKVL